MSHESPPYGFFYHLNNPFCEGKEIGIHSSLNGHMTITEVANTVSNLMYIFAGIWGFLSIYYRDSLSYVTSALTIVMGIGSALYHATFWYGFGIIDGLGMHFLSIFLVLSIVEDLIYTMFTRPKSNDKVVMAIWYLLVMLYFAFDVQQKTLMDEWSWGEKELLSILIGIIIAVFVAWSIIIQFTSYWDMQYNCDAKIIALLASVSMAVAYGFHIFDDGYCNNKSVYVFAHALWHILSGYSILCVIVFTAYIRSSLYSVKVSNNVSIGWKGPFPYVTYKYSHCEVVQRVLMMDASKNLLQTALPDNSAHESYNDISNNRLQSSLLENREQDPTIIVT